MLAAAFTGTSVVSAALPLRWGWRAFPLVLLILLVALVVVLFGPTLLLPDRAGGTVIHLNALLLVPVIVAFCLTLAIRRRLHNVA